MSSTKYAAALAGVAMLAGSLYAGPAGAAAAGSSTSSTLAPSASAAAATAGSACGMAIGSITAAGDLGGAGVSATTPPTRSPVFGQPPQPHLFPAGSAKLSTTWERSFGVGSDFREDGNVVLGSTFSRTHFAFDGVNWITGTNVVGGGWGSFRAIASPDFYPPFSVSRPKYLYGLRNDGVLLRWAARGASYSRPASYPGFSSVKAMTVISQTATYDTFLANTRGGALYTIRIPVTSPMTTVVKKVRSTTWQGFEFLLAENCGRQSILLAGIDKDTGSAYLYAVSHATGATTVILTLGRIPGTFPDPVYYLRHPELNNLNGE
jgi:hypothetical protein